MTAGAEQVGVAEQTAATLQINADTARLNAEAAKTNATASLNLQQTSSDQTLAKLARDKAILEALNGVATAEKLLAESRRDADLARTQAQLGVVKPAAGAGTGQVTVQKGAGAAEAAWLAAHAYGVAAKLIASEIGDRMSIDLVIVQGSGIAELSAYSAFKSQKSFLQQELKAAISEGEAIKASSSQAGAGSILAAAQVATAAAAPIATTLGIGLELLSNLGSYFRSDYDLGGIELIDRQELLLSAVAGAVRTKFKSVKLPGCAINTIAEVEAIFDTLPNDLATAKTLREQLQGDVAENQRLIQSEADQTRKAALERAAAEMEGGALGLERAIKANSDFLASVSAADPTGTPLLAKIVRQHALYKATQGQNVKLLFVEAHSTAGGYYVKKNLWTFLGTMPFYIMGGAVVSFALTDASGAVDVAGVIPIHSGFKKVQNVRRILRPGSVT